MKKNSGTRGMTGHVQKAAKTAHGTSSALVVASTRRFGFRLAQTQKGRSYSKKQATMTSTAVSQQQQYAPQQPADAAPGPIYIDTQHEDLVHDAQCDYYGSKLATCSSGAFVVLCCFACLGGVCVLGLRSSISICLFGVID